MWPGIPINRRPEEDSNQIVYQRYQQNKKNSKTVSYELKIVQYKYFMQEWKLSAVKQGLPFFVIFS